MGFSGTNRAAEQKAGAGRDKIGKAAGESHARIGVGQEKR
jgi:hypothetical protein